MEWNANIWVLIFKMSMVVMKLVTWKIQKRTQSTVALVSKTSNLTLKFEYFTTYKFLGCSFGGLFHINKVPGNFHISTHSSQVQPKRPDMNHAIRSLSFGDPMTGVKLPANFEPLQGKDTKGKDPMASHDYTLKIVPTVYTDINRRTRFGYQYTAVYKGEIYRYKYSGRKSTGEHTLNHTFRFCCIWSWTACYACNLVPL